MRVHAGAAPRGAGRADILRLHARRCSRSPPRPRGGGRRSRSRVAGGGGAARRNRTLPHRCSTSVLDSLRRPALSVSPTTTGRTSAPVRRPLEHGAGAAAKIGSGHERQRQAPACWPATLQPRWGAPGDDQVVRGRHVPAAQCAAARPPPAAGDKRGPAGAGPQNRGKPQREVRTCVVVADGSTRSRTAGPPPGTPPHARGRRSVPSPSPHRRRGGPPAPSQGPVAARRRAAMPATIHGAHR